MREIALHRKTIANALDVAVRLARYNLKIIFANKFVFFFLGSVAFFLFLNVVFVFSDATASLGVVYYYLLFPGLLLVFYPSAFGIQNDVDVRMIEILFGIPDYRYKVWLTRLVMMFVLSFVTLVALAALASFFVMPTPAFSLAAQVMVPVLFWGCLGFALSTVIRSGAGTAATMIILGLSLFILSGALQASKWNPFLNPYNMPTDMSTVVWATIVRENRLYLLAGSFLLLLFALLNLQKRERFV